MILPVGTGSRDVDRIGHAFEAVCLPGAFSPSANAHDSDTRQTEQRQAGRLGNDLDTYIVEEHTPFGLTGAKVEIAYVTTNPVVPGGATPESENCS